MSPAGGSRTRPAGGRRTSPTVHPAEPQAAPDPAPSRRAEGPTGHPDGVRATARVRATHNGRVTALPELHSDGPFHVRRMRTGDNTAKVGIIGAMSAPLGGDRLTIEVTAEDLAELDVTTAAATRPCAAPPPTRPPMTCGSRRGKAPPCAAAATADQRGRQQPAPDLHRRTRRHRTARPARGTAPGPGRRGAGPPRQPRLRPPRRAAAPDQRTAFGAPSPAGTGRPCSTDTAPSANSCSWARR